MTDKTQYILKHAAYATADDVERGFRPLSAQERETAEQLLYEAALLIDAYRRDASEEAKNVVSVRVVRRAIGSGRDAMGTVPYGATTGSMSALGYSQSWTMQGGTVGEVYLTKTEKTILGAAGRIGIASPYEMEGGAND